MTQWLDEDEMAAWLPLIRIVHALPQALDKKLREEVGIPHNYYGMLATLSSQPDRTLTMGDLARLTASSPSRLSHAITALEQRGWVSRRQCGEDKRRQFVTLTDDGLATPESDEGRDLAELCRARAGYRLGPAHPRAGPPARRDRVGDRRQRGARRGLNGRLPGRNRRLSAVATLTKRRNHH